MRKIYADLIRNRIRNNDFSWLFKRSFQYALIHVSFLLKRPLCGPILGTLLTNYTCNFRCQMCDLYSRDGLLKKSGLKELSTTQLKGILHDFASLGTSGIGFTGGEPLLRSDIFELLNFSKQLGMVTHLNTNGYFINEANANKLLDCRIDSLNISLDGAEPDTHDKIRGFKGAFDKAIDALQCIDRLRRKRKIPLRIKTVTVLNEDNINEVKNLVSLAANLNTDCIEFIPEQNFRTHSGFSNSNIGNKEYSENFFNGLDRVINYLLNVKEIRIENSPDHLKMFKDSFRAKKSPLICYAGYNSLGVDCYGQIYPCMSWFNWNIPVGNIKEISLKDFWYSKRYNKTRKNISKCRDCYINCQSELNLLFNLGFKKLKGNIK